MAVSIPLRSGPSTVGWGIAIAACVLVSLLQVPLGGPSGPVPHAADVGSAGLPGLPAASVSAPGTVRSSVAHPGAIGGLNITIQNPGTNATGTYDQPIGINSSEYASLINTDWSNGIAEYTANGTPIYGWIESGASNTSWDTVLWLRLNSIPASGSTNVSLWFWPKNSTNLSENGYMGENPLLSTPYAEFDNGWRVFDAYANFSGTSLPADWSPLGSWVGTVRDGLTVASSSATGAVEDILPSSYSSTLTVEAESRTSGSGGPLVLFVAGATGIRTGSQFFPNAYALEPGVNGNSTGGLLTSGADGIPVQHVAVVNAPTDFAQSLHVVGLTWRAANASEVGSVNYVPFISQINATNGPLVAYGLGAVCNATCPTWSVAWTRVRSSPDPMPVVSNEAFAPAGVVVASVLPASDPGLPSAFTCTTSTSVTSPSYAWNFSDGGYASGRVVAHAFSHAGTYSATCTVSGPLGAVGSDTIPFRVNADLTILLFQAVPSTIDIGSGLNLIVNVTGGTSPFLYSYAGLPPGCPNHDTATLTCLPGVTGTFAIEVTVEDSVGVQTSNSITITVMNPPTPSPPTLTPFEGYVLAGAVAGVVVLAGVLPVLLFTARRRPPPPPPGNGSRAPRGGTAGDSPRGDPP